MPNTHARLLRALNSNAISRTEASSTFEGLVDLFSLLAFVIITVAVAFGAAPARSSGDSAGAVFTFEEVTTGVGGTEIPEDTVLILVSEYQGPVQVLLAESGEAVRNLGRHLDDVLAALDRELPTLANRKELILAVEGRSDLLLSMLVDVQRWFASHRLTIRVVFA